MFRFLLLLFVTVPLMELYVLIEVGSGIGGFSTIALCLLTAAVGGVLIRWQGLETLLSAQRELLQGGLPAAQVVHGMMLAVAGVLLFIPGFITDTLGFFLLIPQVRSWLIRRFWASNLPPTTSASNHIIDAEIIEEHHTK